MRVFPVFTMIHDNLTDRKAIVLARRYKQQTDARLAEEKANAAKA